MTKTIEHAELYLDVIFTGLEENSNRPKRAHHTQLPELGKMSADKLLDGFKGLIACIGTMIDTKV